MAVCDTERALYDELWSSVEPYAAHAPGEHYASAFLEFAGSGLGLSRPPTVLDAGCGTGKGGLVLARAGYTVTLADLTDAGLDPAARDLPFRSVCLWHDLRALGRFDYTYCCDVLEHLPPQFTMLAVDQMLRVTRLGLFLSVCLLPDSFGMWVGRPLHQTVQSFVAWRDALRDVGDVVDARDLIANAIFYVRPRLLA